jgi:hypothetical protein
MMIDASLWRHHQVAANGPARGDQRHGWGFRLSRMR